MNKFSIFVLRFRFGTESIKRFNDKNSYYVKRT